MSDGSAGRGFDEFGKRVLAGVQSAEFYKRLRDFDPRTITRWPMTVVVDSASAGSLFVWHGSPDVLLARADSWVVVAYPRSRDLTVEMLHAWKMLVEACPTGHPDARRYLASTKKPGLGSAMYGATGTGLDDFALRWVSSGDWVGLFLHLIPGP